MSDTDKESDKIFYCSFCGKTQSEVGTLIVGVGEAGRICERCLNVCIVAFHKEGCLDQLPAIKEIMKERGLTHSTKNER